MLRLIVTEWLLAQILARGLTGTVPYKEEQPILGSAGQGSV